MKSESDALWSSPGGSACPRPQGKATEGRMFASVAPREVLARLRRGVAKPQVKPLIGVSDPYSRGRERAHVGRLADVRVPAPAGTVVIGGLDEDRPELDIPGLRSASSRPRTDGTHQTPGRSHIA